MLHSIITQIKQNILFPYSMNYQVQRQKTNKNIERHISSNQSFSSKQILQNQGYHLRLSEPKSKHIKINKNKLPNDFFQKKEKRRVSEQKIYVPHEFTEPIIYSKKIESQRIIQFPEKTSFFGFLQEKKSNSISINAPFKFLNRKFETRQQPKRDYMYIDSNRKLTNTSKGGKRDLLELFPQTYDEQMSNILTETSKTHMLRTNLKKEPLSFKRQKLFINPEKLEHKEPIFNSARKPKESQMKNVSLLDNQFGQGMNITFYKAKSNCLPPIHHNIQQKMQ